MIYTASIDEPINDYDTSELLDLEWFSYRQILEMATDSRLHAGYEHLAVEQAIDALG